MHTEPLAPSSPAASADILDGTPYRTVRKLGAGGMGEVLEAEHRDLGKRVVVKLLRRELSGDPGLVERLRLEARAMAKLRNPHVAEVHDLGTTPGGRPYFVLEYLEGCTVSQALRKSGPFPVDEAIRVVLEVLDGLGAAHAAGLVHRDVKPANVFLCAPDRDGKRRTKLLDFGVVKVRSARVPRHFPTEQGQFIGSPATAAPEQARGEEVDGRADLYAAGLLLFFLVAGKSPFSGATMPQLMLAAQVVTVPPPLSSVAAQAVPPLLDMVVAKALSKRPEDRYASARQMAAALERVLAALPVTGERSAPVPARGRTPGGAGDGAGGQSHGTLVLDRGARGVPAVECVEILDSVTLPVTAPAARPVQWILHAWTRIRGAGRRAAPGVLVALLTGSVLFGLLCLAWRILRGAS